MQVFTNKVIPVDMMFAKIWRDTKAHPWYFLGELFAVVMMVIGAISAIRWSYEVGRQIGHML